MEVYTVLGIMSGSSLDGVDLVFCRFEKTGNLWHYSIEKAKTIHYSTKWQTTLSHIYEQRGNTLIDNHIMYGKYLGQLANDFLESHCVRPDFIASHGHTVFHNPYKGYTYQLGNGQAIATTTGITVISDFRTKDILLGGQGAPLVSVGDELLFSKFDYCLNIGGIVNISFKKQGKRQAFDICPANQLLNHLSRQLGKAYDENGNFASLGKMNNKLFSILNDNSFYRLPVPKSLSNEYVHNTFFQLIDTLDAPIENKLFTIIKHIAYQINNTFEGKTGKNVLITGGGAHNGFLINSIKMVSGQQIILPSEQLIDFKEAMIFAFLGTLRLRGETNCLASATGASKDSSGGNIYFP